MKDRLLNVGLSSSCLFAPADGPSNYTYDLIKGLCIIEKKDRFHLVYGEAPLFRKNLIDFRQHNLSDHRPFLSLRIDPKLDLYHETCPFTTGRTLSRKAVITVHDISRVVRHDLYPDISDHITSAAFKQHLSMFDIIIVPSEHTRNDLVRHLQVEGNRISVIPGGIFEEFSPQSTYRTGLLKTRYGLKRPYILFVGPVEERKNIARVIEAYSLLKYESPPDLVIAGEKRRLKEPLKDLLKRYDVQSSVKYLGYVPKKDMPALYSGAELFFWPSLYEGFGLPVLEAMSCGTPVISSDTTSIPETAGKAAMLVDPCDPDEMAGAMRDLLSGTSKREEMRREGLRISGRYSAKAMASATLELYRKAAA